MKLDKDVTIIDDFIDEEYQEDIKNILIGNKDFAWEDQEITFDWYFISDVTDAYAERQQKRWAFTHEYAGLDWGEDEDDELNNLFIPMLSEVCKKMDFDNLKILQGRSFLQFPIKERGKPDTPHIDIYDRSHIVALYYVCDSDGDTIIYNERRKTPDKVYTVKKRVTPKQGRIVIFDGTLYHTAEQPLNNTRCIVNYNIE